MSDIQFLRELMAVFPNFQQYVAESFGPAVGNVVAKAAAPPTPVAANPTPVAATAAPAGAIRNPGPGIVNQPPVPATPTAPPPTPGISPPQARGGDTLGNPGLVSPNFGSLLGAAKAPIGKRLGG